MLTDCVAPQGLTEWDHFRPALSVAEYAVFYPRHDHYGSLPWGVYDLNGRLNARAALIQEKSNLGHGQEWIAASPRCSMDMPEIESAVYGGMIGLHYGHTLLELLPRLW
ncbi:hypothetical protein AA0472_1809 [Acetobacter estunensis NRIC 0472]|uniref:Uncharacterized protein n=1 Tax=Acetobacter estunensis TaxID=104097 RepID=A0A967EE34_9PROT|nr:hypothetical protein [Acetobacter estunensis]NHO54640.1 hypothetical protein [Acetobacter estunensis]GBQ25598.1 hypothetical protein AA0472_1809 [Acetobacter estunensis NRIC 0472]